VEAHAHPDRRTCRPVRLGQGTLRRRGGPDRIARLLERCEERVALTVDLDPARVGKRVPEDRVVRRERLAVPLVAELAEQLGRALDVGEEEGDGARRRAG
jgi:hypothetical protein